MGLGRTGGGMAPSHHHHHHRSINECAYTHGLDGTRRLRWEEQEQEQGMVVVGHKTRNCGISAGEDRAQFVS